MLEKILESPLDCKEIQPVHPKGDQSWVFIGKDWCWRWSSNTLATWCKELTHWKRPWCWERLKAGGEGDNRGWDGWMTSLTQWTWVWASSRSWWWTGQPGVLQSMGLQRVGPDWVTELNWKLNWKILKDINEWSWLLWSWMGDSNFFNFIHRFYDILIKILVSVFIELVLLILKCMWKNKELCMAKTHLRKYKLEVVPEQICNLV